MPPVPSTEAQQAQSAFLQAVKGKQRINTKFYDTFTVATTGLGTATTPASILAFTGANAGDPILTNFETRDQLEQDEYADLVGVSLTPVAAIQIFEGVSAAAASAAMVFDVDTILKKTVLKIRIGTNNYGPWPTHMIGGDGGLGGMLAASGSLALPSILTAAVGANGSPEVGKNWKWTHFVRWPGNKRLVAELIGKTGALVGGTAINIKCGLEAAPYYRNFVPEKGLHYGS